MVPPGVTPPAATVRVVWLCKGFGPPGRRGTAHCALRSARQFWVHVAHAVPLHRGAVALIAATAGMEQSFGAEDAVSMKQRCHHYERGPHSGATWTAAPPLSGVQLPPRWRTWALARPYPDAIAGSTGQRQSEQLAKLRAMELDTPHARGYTVVPVLSVVSGPFVSSAGVRQWPHESGIA